MHNVLPFERGTTHRGTSGTIDTSDYGESVRLEGLPAETVAWGTPSSSGVKAKLTGTALQKCRIVRNVSGIALKANRLVKYQTGKYHKRVDGYTTTNYERADGVVDPALGTTTVRNGDLFWMVYQGPCTVLTSTDADAGNVIAEYGEVFAATNAASTNTTDSGGCRSGETWSVAGVTGGLDEDKAYNKIGIALTARTTANTGGAAALTTTLVDLRLYS